MRFWPWIVLFGTLFLWSANWIVARAVRDDIAPGFATSGRLLVVIALLAPFCWRGLASKLPTYGRAEWNGLLLAGAAGGGLHLAFQWLGLHYTTATSATLYLSTSPLFILLLARPLLGERIGALQWVGVLVSFLGVGLIGTQGRFELVSFNVGDLLALVSMMMWAAYTVFLRMRKDSLDTPEFICLISMMGLAILAPWVLWEAWMGKKVALSPAGTAAVLYSAIGSLLLAYAGWNYVVKRLGAARAGATMHLMPGMAAVLAMIFLDEYPQWFHFAGIALILAGVGLSTYVKTSARPSAG